MMVLSRAMSAIMLGSCTPLRSADRTRSIFDCCKSHNWLRVNMSPFCVTHCPGQTTPPFFTTRFLVMLVGRVTFDVERLHELRLEIVVIVSPCVVEGAPRSLDDNRSPSGSHL